MQTYQTIAPSAVLKPFVNYFWVLESKDTATQTFQAIVDGCPGAIILGPDKQAFCDEHNHQLPGLLLYGQTIKPVRLSVAGSFGAIGICFQPHALKSVFGLDAHEWTNACLDLQLLAGRKQGQLSERLSRATSWHERLDLLSSFLLQQLQQHQTKADAPTQEALTRIIHSKGTLDLQQLQQQLRLSERGLERRF